VNIHIVLFLVCDTNWDGFRRVLWYSSNIESNSSEWTSIPCTQRWTILSKGVCTS